MRDQVSRQVQTETRRTYKKEAPSFARSEEGPESEAWGEQEDARPEGRTEPARHYPQRAPDSRKLTQTTHERNQAEHAWTPKRVGGPGHSHWQDTGPRSQELQRERARAVRAVSQSPVGKRCRRCSTLKEKRVSKRHTPDCPPKSRQFVVH